MLAAKINPLLSEAGLAWLKSLVFSLSEATAIGALAYSLTGEKLVWWKLLLSSLITGLVMGTVSVILEDQMLPFMIHVLLYMVILVILFNVFRLAIFWRVLTAVTFALAIYLLLEFLNLGVRYLCHIDLNQYRESFSAKIICFLPQFFSALLLAYIFYRRKINLFITKGKEV